MVIEMPPKTAVERSDNRDIIDDLLLEGKSPRFVSDYIKNELNENISHTAINNYRKNKLNVKKEMAIKYHEKVSKEKKEKKVAKGLSDLDRLDNFISECDDVKLDTDSLHPDDITSSLDIEKHKLSIKKSGVHAIKIKNDVLKDNPDPPTFIFNLDSKKERLKRIEGTNDYSNPQKNSARNKPDS